MPNWSIKIAPQCHHVTPRVSCHPMSPCYYVTPCHPMSPCPPMLPFHPLSPCHPMSPGHHHVIGWHGDMVVPEVTCIIIMLTFSINRWMSYWTLVLWFCLLCVHDSYMIWKHLTCTRSPWPWHAVLGGARNGASNKSWEEMQSTLLSSPLKRKVCYFMYLGRTPIRFTLIFRSTFRKVTESVINCLSLIKMHVWFIQWMCHSVQSTLKFRDLYQLFIFRYFMFMIRL